jgi:nicotinamide mononucleotide (NMN) deamidase PncC
MDLDTLFALGQRVGDKLVARGETLAVAESSAGGLLSAHCCRAPARRPTTSAARCSTPAARAGC